MPSSCSQALVGTAAQDCRASLESQLLLLRAPLLLPFRGRESVPQAALPASEAPAIVGSPVKADARAGKTTSKAVAPTKETSSKAGAPSNKKGGKPGGNSEEKGGKGNKGGSSQAAVPAAKLPKSGSPGGTLSAGQIGKRLQGVRNSIGIALKRGPAALGSQPASKKAGTGTKKVRLHGLVTCPQQQHNNITLAGNIV